MEDRKITSLIISLKYNSIFVKHFCNVYAINVEGPSGANFCNDFFSNHMLVFLYFTSIVVTPMGEREDRRFLSLCLRHVTLLSLRTINRFIDLGACNVWTCPMSVAITTFTMEPSVI